MSNKKTLFLKHLISKTSSKKPLVLHIDPSKNPIQLIINKEPSEEIESQITQVTPSALSFRQSLVDSHVTPSTLSFQQTLADPSTLSFQQSLADSHVSSH